MRYTKHLIQTSSALFAGVLLSACSSSMPFTSNDFIYRNINFGPDRDTDFKKGVQDGCRTADGTYTKDQNKFRDLPSYRVGWEDGRLQCKDKH